MNKYAKKWITDSFCNSMRTITYRPFDILEGSAIKISAIMLFSCWEKYWSMSLCLADSTGRPNIGTNPLAMPLPQASIFRKKEGRKRDLVKMKPPAKKQLTAWYCQTLSLTLSHSLALSAYPFFLFSLLLPYFPFPHAHLLPSLSTRPWSENDSFLISLLWHSRKQRTLCQSTCSNQGEKNLFNEH